LKKKNGKGEIEGMTRRSDSKVVLAYTERQTDRVTHTYSYLDTDIGADTEIGREKRERHTHRVREKDTHIV